MKVDSPSHFLSFSKSLIFSIHTCASFSEGAASRIRGFLGSSSENTANACGRDRDFALRTTQPDGNSTVPAGAPASLQYTASDPPPTHIGLGRSIHHCLFHDCQMPIINNHYHMNPRQTMHIHHKTHLKWIQTEI